MGKQTIITSDQTVFTLVNTFTVEPDRQQRLVDTLVETTETIVQHLPGFISASIHTSMDGLRVINYGQWKDKEAFEALMRNPEMQARVEIAKELGQPDGHFYRVAATVVGQDEPRTVAATPLEIYRRFQYYLSTGTFDRMHEVVDLDHYTENCVGFTTGWVTGFHAALDQYISGVASAMADLKVTEENVVEGVDSLVIRNSVEATHVGPLLGIPATGKRFTYEATDMLRFRDGRIVWRWLLSDLYAIEQQLVTTQVC